MRNWGFSHNNNQGVTPLCNLQIYTLSVSVVLNPKTINDNLREFKWNRHQCNRKWIAQSVEKRESEQITWKKCTTQLILFAKGKNPSQYCEKLYERSWKATNIIKCHPLPACLLVWCRHGSKYLADYISLQHVISHAGLMTWFPLAFSNSNRKCPKVGYTWECAMQELVKTCNLRI